MRRLVAAMLIGGVATTGCAGIQPRVSPLGAASWHWDNVVALPQGALIRVVTADRRADEGTFIAADGETLSLQTRHGASSVPASIVHRVDRLAVRPRRRGHRALVSAAAGAASVAIVWALFSQATAGRLSLPAPGSLAKAATLFGALGALGDGSRTMTIYLRP
jgi:hypothetical protein